MLNLKELETKTQEILADFQKNPPKNVEADEEHLAKYCDHTVLKAYTTKDTVKTFCEEAKKYGSASICVNPYYVPLVKKELAGTGIKTCCVIGFPLGANTPETKAFEAKNAQENGAEELDMVINVGALRDKDYELVYRDIKGVVDCKGSAKVKVIIETCYLSEEERVKACLLSLWAGADFVKTSTGFGTDGAYVHDILLMRKAVGDKILVKASTNVTNRAEALAMVHAGAVRLGVSRTPQIATGDDTIVSATVTNKAPKYSHE